MLGGVSPFVISATSEPALFAQAGRLRKFVEKFSWRERGRCGFLPGVAFRFQAPGRGGGRWA